LTLKMKRKRKRKRKTTDERTNATSEAPASVLIPFRIARLRPVLVRLEILILDLQNQPITDLI
jgi:hypothetical protein